MSHTKAPGSIASRGFSLSRRRVLGSDKAQLSISSDGRVSMNFGGEFILDARFVGGSHGVACGHGAWAQFSDVGWVERQHNTLFGYASGH